MICPRLVLRLVLGLIRVNRAGGMSVRRQGIGVWRSRRARPFKSPLLKTLDVPHGFARAAIAGDTDGNVSEPRTCAAGVGGGSLGMLRQTTICPQTPYSSTVPYHQVQSAPFSQNSGNRYLDRTQTSQLLTLSCVDGHSHEPLRHCILSVATLRYI